MYEFDIRFESGCLPPYEQVKGCYTYKVADGYLGRPTCGAWPPMRPATQSDSTTPPSAPS